MIQITRILNQLNHLDNIKKGVYEKQEKECAERIIKKYMQSYEFQTQIKELQRIMNESKNIRIKIKCLGDN